MLCNSLRLVCDVCQLSPIQEWFLILEKPVLPSKESSFSPGGYLVMPGDILHIAMHRTALQNRELPFSMCQHTELEKLSTKMIRMKNAGLGGAKIR